MLNIFHTAQTIIGGFVSPKSNSQPGIWLEQRKEPMTDNSIDDENLVNRKHETYERSHSMLGGILK